MVDPKDIDYIVCAHTEPDHSGLIGLILDLAPNATVVGSKVSSSSSRIACRSPSRSEW